MAFKERFKDRNIITGKNGENAQLVPTGPATGPKKGAGPTKEPHLDNPPQFLQPAAATPVFAQQPSYAVYSPPNVMQPPAATLGKMPAFGQPAAPSLGKMQMPAMAPQQSMAPPMLMRQPSIATNAGNGGGMQPPKFQPPVMGGGAQPGQPMHFQPPPAAGASKAPSVAPMQAPMLQLQGGGMAPGMPSGMRPQGSFMMPPTPQGQPAFMAPTPTMGMGMGIALAGPQPPGGPVRLSMAPGAKAAPPPPIFMATKQPSPAPSPTPGLQPQPSLGAPGAAGPSFMMPPPGNGPTNVGSYNYQAAQAVPAPEPGKDKDIKHGRRATSTEPNGAKPKGGGGGVADEDRPGTDPDKPHYKPYTLEDYRKMKDDTSKMVMRRGLGPVDNEEVRAEREKRQKMLDYAANATKINKALEGPDSDEEEQERKPIVQPVAQDVVERQQRRDRALQYGKNVPKPKVKPKEELSPAAGPVAGDNLDVLAAENDHTAARREKEKALLDLEAKHKRDQQMIENIKKQLKLA